MWGVIGIDPTCMKFEDQPMTWVYKSLPIWQQNTCGTFGHVENLGELWSSNQQRSKSIHLVSSKIIEAKKNVSIWNI